MNAPDSLPPDLVRLVRALRTLMALTVCLLALLVLGLGVGAWFAVQRVSELETAARQQATALQEAGVQLGREATRRQEGLSDGLVETSRATRERLGPLTERRKGLSSHPPDPLAKLDRVIDLNVLVADELLLLLRHATDTQSALGRDLRPLPKQRALSPRGSGR